MPGRRSFPKAAALACLLGSAPLLAAGAAMAQIVPLFGNQGPFLDKADYALADVAAHKLLDPQPAALGTIADWSNPVSGNRGVLTMGRAYQKDGNDCRSVRWRDVFKAGPERTVLLDTCRISGVWKLM